MAPYAKTIHKNMKVIDEKKIGIEFIKRAINVVRWRRMALSLVVLLKGEGYLDAT